MVLISLFDPVMTAKFARNVVERGRRTSDFRVTIVLGACVRLDNMIFLCIVLSIRLCRESSQPHSEYTVFPVRNLTVRLDKPIALQPWDRPRP
jgi:hypothetical protein